VEESSQIEACERTSQADQRARSQAIPGNGGHNNYGRGEKSSDHEFERDWILFRLGGSAPRLESADVDGVGKWRDIVGGCE
jgi:hypothetical protein